VILSVGMTPAWQRMYVFDRLASGEVNRAVETHECASGKVLNVVRAASALGEPASCVTFVGGITGEAIVAEFAAANLAARWVRTATPTRVCTTIIERSSGVVTELVENAAAIPPDDWTTVRTAVRKELKRCRVVVLTGSLPAGSPPRFWPELFEGSLGGLNPVPPIIADLSGPALLDVLPLRPAVVKPNRHELSTTLQRPLETPDAVVAACRELIGRGARAVVVTDGPRETLLVTADDVVRVATPKVTAVNPIGCGDCVAATLAIGILHGRPLVESLSHAAAVAADNATRMLPADVNRERIAALRSRVVIA
jgi:1-phosphofructokinase family hexose kinase